MEAQPEIPTSDAEDLEEFVDDFDDNDDDDDDDNFEEEELEDDVMESLVRRLSAEEWVVIRVNDVIIKGNTRTSKSLVAAEVEPIFRAASSFRQLLLAAAESNTRLQQLGLFDSVTITLDAGPPGTANVVVEVSEAQNRLTGDLWIYCQPEVVLLISGCMYAYSTLRFVF